jgi:hypothetical protein
MSAQSCAVVPTSVCRAPISRRRLTVNVAALHSIGVRACIRAARPSLPAGACPGLNDRNGCGSPGMRRTTAVFLSPPPRPTLVPPRPWRRAAVRRSATRCPGPDRADELVSWVKPFDKVTVFATYASLGLGTWPRPWSGRAASNLDHGWSASGLSRRSDPLCCRTARRVQRPAVGSHAADDPG